MSVKIVYEFILVERLRWVGVDFTDTIYVLSSYSYKFKVYIQL